MQTNNLYHYIKTGGFLEKMSTVPEGIIRENLPHDAVSHLGASRSKTDNIGLEQLGYDFRPDGDVYNYILDKKNVIIIIDTIGITSCIDMIRALPKDIIIKVVNLGVGISGVQNKHSLENNDYAVIADALPIYEPIDETQYMQYIASSASMYIRIVHDEIVTTLFSGENAKLYAERDIPMTDFGYTGIGGTILVQPGLLVSVTQALQYLQTEKSIGFDLFVHTGPRDVYSQRLVDSLHFTGKLIIMHDQTQDDTIRIREQKATKASNIQGTLHVLFKKPDYAKITTILPEYMYEQGGYDPESLASYLLSIA